MLNVDFQTHYIIHCISMYALYKKSLHPFPISLGNKRHFKSSAECFKLVMAVEMNKPGVGLFF